MLNTVAIGTMAMSLLAAPAATERADLVPPPPNKIQVSVVTANGSGCRAGSVAVAPSIDNTAFTVTYSDFMAQAGGASRPTDMRKNCQLVVRVRVPQGFTVAVAQADYRGYANIKRGATGTERASYYWQGSSATGHSTHDIPGSYNDTWQFTDRAGVIATVWSPCGAERNLNINQEVVVDRGSSAPGQTSFMTMDSTDGSANTIFHVSWARCP
jgi:hypothetical protein